MNKNLLVFLIIMLIIGAAAAVVILISSFPKCEGWIVNGKCITERPPEPVPRIVIFSLIPGEEIFSPLKITGYVNGGGWSGFEGQVGIVDLKFRTGDAIEILASAPLFATTEWTKPPTYFETTLDFNRPAAPGEATLEFSNENPSGLAENNRQFILPVEIITGQEKTTIKIYFNNNKMDPEFSCNKVFAVLREIPKTQAVARAALEGLLSGPTVSEKDQGFFTSINEGVKINSLVVQDGVARVDFDPQLEYQVGGSCRVSAIRAQIIQTLKQFPTVKNVIISINGRTEDILQP